MELTDNIRVLKGIGDKSAVLFEKLGIYSVADLLDHFPRNYDVYKRPTLISELREGYIGAVECVVSSQPKLIHAGGYAIVTTRLNDGSGELTVSWFNQPYLTKTIRPGSRYIFRGNVTKRKGVLKMSQPQVMDRISYEKRMRELQPVYPTCAGLSNNTISKAVKQASGCISMLRDYMTPAQCNKLGLLTFSAAIEQIHFPLDKNNAEAARRRLVFDDFFVFLCMGRILKRKQELIENKHRITDHVASDRLIASLPYELTGAQKRVIDEIRSDMAAPCASTRMIQGDVGSGKTIVAVAALYEAAVHGHQGCIMVPTDVLAKQHYESISALLKPLGVGVSLLTGRMTGAEKRKAREALRKHETDIVVGTHALIQESVDYADLAVAVIDEQHRFGVRQRELIRSKGLDPYILVMSATPIPRSLAIILYGDMQISVIDEMPKNRLPIKNCVIGSDQRSTAYNFIKSRIREGHQAYVICPMIEESDELDTENVTEYRDKLIESLDDHSITVECMHGKLKKDEKERILDSFYRGDTDILVSTTVVEVGVNVPNATVMMVENAERFGLAQLHQLRGRVGRGSAQSYCIFVKGMESDEINERLDILVKYNDGMSVAQKDLELRGPGEMFGEKQSGELGFRVADIIGDSGILALATNFLNSISDEDTDKLVERNPEIFITVDSLGDVI